MTDLEFSVGDPVWSKMKGYCPWPSRIAAPTESSLRNTAADKLKTQKVHYLVYFFGSNNFAWMPEDTIKPYEEFKDKNKNGSKSAQFKQGLKQIEEYIANGGKATLGDTVTGAAIKNSTVNDGAMSPSAGGDSLSNDASNLDDLPSIDEEIAAIHNKKPASSSTSSKKLKSSLDSHNDSSSLTSPVPSSVQKDYSRTPFKSRKTAKSDEASTEIITKKLKASDDDSLRAASPSSPTISAAITTSRPPTSRFGSRNVVLRAPQFSDLPTFDAPKINMSFVSTKSKSVRASNQKFGFIGLGFMGQRLVRNLLSSGHNVTIYNRSVEKCNEFLEAGASHAKTCADVVAESDIIFSCVSDPKASKEVVFGTFGVLGEMNSSKGFVDMSSIDAETSNDISEAIVTRGGRYLEAPIVVHGKKAAEEGELIILAAGDKTLYEDCSSCFQAMGKEKFYMGHQPGLAAKMNLTVSMLYGSMVATIAECCSLLSVSDLPIEQFRDILKLSVMNCPLVDSTVEKMKKQDWTPSVPLGHLQKDLRLSLAMSEEIAQPCPITAVINETFKGARRAGYNEADSVAVYVKARF